MGIHNRYVRHGTVHSLLSLCSRWISPKHITLRPSSLNLMTSLCVAQWVFCPFKRPCHDKLKLEESNGYYQVIRLLSTSPLVLTNGSRWLTHYKVTLVCFRFIRLFCLFFMCLRVLRSIFSCIPGLLHEGPSHCSCSRLLGSWGDVSTLAGPLRGQSDTCPAGSCKKFYLTDRWNYIWGYCTWWRVITESPEHILSLCSSRDVTALVTAFYKCLSSAPSNMVEGSVFMMLASPAMFSPSIALGKSCSPLIDFNMMLQTWHNNDSHQKLNAYLVNNVNKNTVNKGLIAPLTWQVYNKR